MLFPHSADMRQHHRLLYFFPTRQYRGVKLVYRQLGDKPCLGLLSRYMQGDVSENLSEMALSLCILVSVLEPFGGLRMTRNCAPPPNPDCIIPGS